jgi:hypothetical protein
MRRPDELTLRTTAGIISPEPVVRRSGKMTERRTSRRVWRSVGGSEALTKRTRDIFIAPETAFYTNIGAKQGKFSFLRREFGLGEKTE